MRIKDHILATLIAVNVLLVVFVAAVFIQQSESVAQAGAATDRAGFVRACTLKYADDREGLVVIDTLTNQLKFYTHVEGRKEVVKAGPTAEVFTKENLRATYGGRLALLEEAGQALSQMGRQP